MDRDEDFQELNYDEALGHLADLLGKPVMVYVGSTDSPRNAALLEGVLEQGLPFDEIPKLAGKPLDHADFAADTTFFCLEGSALFNGFLVAGEQFEWAGLDDRDPPSLGIRHKDGTQVVIEPLSPRLALRER